MPDMCLNGYSTQLLINAKYSAIDIFYFATAFQVLN